jgi:hypothetical protein
MFYVYALRPPPPAPESPHDNPAKVDSLSGAKVDDPGPPSYTPQRQPSVPIGDSQITIEGSIHSGRLDINTMCGFPKLCSAFLPACEGIDEWHYLKCKFVARERTLTVHGLSRNASEDLQVTMYTDGSEASTVIYLSSGTFQSGNDYIFDVPDDSVSKTVNLALSQGIDPAVARHPRARAALIKTGLHVGRAVRILKDHHYKPPKFEGAAHDMKNLPILRLRGADRDGRSFEMFLALPDAAGVFETTQFLLSCGCVESTEKLARRESAVHEFTPTDICGDVADVAHEIQRKVSCRDSSPCLRTDVAETSRPLLSSIKGEGLVSSSDETGHASNGALQPAGRDELNPKIISEGLDSVDLGLNIKWGLNGQHMHNKSDGAQQSRQQLLVETVPVNGSSTCDPVPPIPDIAGMAPQAMHNVMQNNFGHDAQAQLNQNLHAISMDLQSISKELHSLVESKVMTEHDLDDVLSLRSPLGASSNRPYYSSFSSKFTDAREVATVVDYPGPTGLVDNHTIKNTDRDDSKFTRLRPRPHPELPPGSPSRPAVPETPLPSLSPDRNSAASKIEADNTQPFSPPPLQNDVHRAERDEKVAEQFKMMFATMVNVFKQEISRVEDEPDTFTLSESEPVGSRSRPSVHGDKNTRGSKEHETKDSAAREKSRGGLAETELPSSELQARKLFAIYDQFYLDRIVKVMCAEPQKP